MTSGGHEVDVGGRGTHSNNILLDFIISAPTIARTLDVHEIDSILEFPGKKLTLWFIAHRFVVGHHPLYVHLMSTKCHSCDRCFQAFPVFDRSSASMYYCKCKPNNKNRGGLGTKLTK